MEGWTGSELTGAASKDGKFRNDREREFNEKTLLILNAITAMERTLQAQKQSLQASLDAIRAQQNTVHGHELSLIAIRQGLHDLWKEFKNAN